jgi:hypothetical protein
MHDWWSTESTFLTLGHFFLITNARSWAVELQRGAVGSLCSCWLYYVDGIILCRMQQTGADVRALLCAIQPGCRIISRGLGAPSCAGVVRASPNASSKGFAVYWTFFRSPSRALKVVSVRRGSIWCPAPRAYPRSTGDASGAGHSEKRGGEWRARCIFDTRTTPNRRLPSDGAVTRKENPHTDNIDARTVWMERKLREKATTALFDICAAIHPCSIRSLRLCLPSPTGRSPSYVLSLSDHEQPLFAIGHR